MLEIIWNFSIKENTIWMHEKNYIFAQMSVKF